MSKEPTKREEPESNEDKAMQAAKQEQARGGGQPAQRQGIPREAIVDPGTPSINEPPGSDVMPPEAKAAIEQANKDAAQQAQNVAGQQQAQQQPGSEQEIADRRRAGQQVPPPTGRPNDDDDDDDDDDDKGRKGKKR